MSYSKLAVLAVVIYLSFTPLTRGQSATQPDEPVAADLLLAGGTIVDGTGGDPYRGDVAIRDGKIVAVGDFETADVRETIDCTDLVVCPGFIDLHNHSDHTLFSPETKPALCYLTQGCTTLVTGNCGSGPVDVEKYYRRLAEQGIGLNIAHLLPHGSLRAEILGKGRRTPDEKELAKMQQLAVAGMEAGAWGMSTGLQYVPGSFAETDELVAIARTVGQHNGIYASHMRNESETLIEAVEETIEIGRQAELPVHISHFKSSKRPNWGKVRVAARIVEEARSAGIRVTADQYPYIASSTSIMAMLLPDDDREGGNSATAKRLQDPAEQERLRSVVAESLEARDRIMIASSDKYPAWTGKLIREVAAEEGRQPIDVAMDLLLDGDAQGVNFSMSEADVCYVMTLPWVATASDGSSKVDDGTRPHPRSFGTFPRKIGRYALGQEVLSLAQAVRSASGLPADILQLKDRGYLRSGLVADIAVLDPDRLADRATFEEPFIQSVGVEWVLVNGEAAIARGEPTGVLAGRPLRKTD